MAELFNYSREEWAAIESAVMCARSDCLSKPERTALCVLATYYLNEQNFRGSMRYVDNASRRARWEKVIDLCKKLQTALKDAVESEGSRRAEEPRWIAVGSFGSGHSSYEPLLWSTDQVRAFLAELEKEATTNQMALLGLAHAPSVSYKRRLEPSVVFQQQILWLWTHQLGGQLSFSIDKTSSPELPYGPLVDYLAAVSVPVMKERAPKLSGLRSLIDRQKEFYDWLEKSGSVKTPLAMLIALGKDPNWVWKSTESGT
jgi:hypothetical protein